MFRGNGGCGYVKKPDILLKAGPDNEVFNPEANLPIKTTLKVFEPLRGSSLLASFVGFYIGLIILMQIIQGFLN